jgi:phosphoribosylglycinamide formyltransferase 1
MPSNQGDSKLVLGLLASGRGSNLQALLTAQEEGRLRARVAVVISDREESAALGRARHHGVPAVFVEPGTTKARLPRPVEESILGLLREHQVNGIVLAGFFRIVGSTLLETFPERVINIHPSLLPSFPGLHAQRQALEHGVKVTGCTVHLVTAGVDEGPILTQAAVPVLDGDTEESLSDRILEQEHRILVEAVNRMAEVGFHLEGRQVRWNRI